MESVIKKDSSLYHFMQWAFFPIVLIGTPYIKPDYPEGYLGQLTAPFKDGLDKGIVK